MHRVGRVRGVRPLTAALAAILMTVAANPWGGGAAHAQGATAPGSRAEGSPSTAGTDKANEKAARDAFERGRVFYDSGQFEQASAAFEEAYKLSGRHALLYNLYLAYRDASEQEKAAQALRGYLAKVPNIENRAQLEARLAALEQNLARQREQQSTAPVVAAAPLAPVVAPASTAPVETSAPVAAPGRSPRFYAGISLAAVGAAAMLSSIATGVLAKKREQKLEDECQGHDCDASLQDTADSGKRLAHTTDALLFGGIALAGAGAALLVFGGLERPAAKAARERPRFTAACSLDGCVAHSTLRF